MVTDARALLPMDLLALVGRGGVSSYDNKAWPRERLGTQETQATLRVLRDQLLALGRQRAAWVSVKRHHLKALVGARHRGGRQAWEIDYLIECCRDDAVLVGLLTQAVQAAGEAGAEKVFLRLEAESDLQQLAKEAGFVPYAEETLYVFSGRLSAEAAECRPAAPADSYPSFRLYTMTTPEAARRHEAATYAEWQAGMERRWLRGGTELVMEREGALVALVRACRLAQGVLFDLMLRGEHADAATGLMTAAMRPMDGDAANGPLLALVPSYAEGVARRLEDAGFQVAGEYVSMVHRTTRPLSLPKVVPAVAKNAVGV